MDLQDVRERLRRKNQILFHRDSSCLQQLRKNISLQDHRTLVLWALACAREPVALLRERYPQEERPETALQLCEDWAAGKIRMPEAKRAILEVHAMAKELPWPADSARCHAVGHACATVHVETHAIGLALYELTAIVRECGLEAGEKKLEEKIVQYLSCLEACAKAAQEPRQWAAFLLKNDRPNKERLLMEK